MKKKGKEFLIYAKIHLAPATTVLAVAAIVVVVLLLVY